MLTGTPGGRLCIHHAAAPSFVSHGSTSLCPHGLAWWHHPVVAPIARRRSCHPQARQQRAGSAASATAAAAVAAATSSDSKGQRPSNVVGSSSSSSSGGGGSSLEGSAGGGGDPGQQQPEWQHAARTVALFSALGALLAYTLLVAPNETPEFDLYVLKLYLKLVPEGEEPVNQVFWAVLNLGAMPPALHGALLSPAGRSRGGSPPVWPFVGLSRLFGMFIMIPYFALWRAPVGDDAVGPMPPRREDMGGWGSLGLRLSESLPGCGLTLCFTLSWIWHGLEAGPAAWAEFATLLGESRLVQGCTLDVALFTLCVPFWMARDARLRRWGPRRWGVPLLALFPVAGPALYLCLRPRAE